MPINNWCSYVAEPEEPLQPIEDGAQPAVMPQNATCWHQDPLLIKFKSDYLLKTWGISDTEILHWIRKWRHDKSNHIPSFKLAEGKDEPHIVVELNSMFCLNFS